MLRPMLRRLWANSMLTVWVVLLVPPGASFAGTTRQDERPKPVPVEEYPIYDRVVIDKFLTSRTRMVVIQRFTATRLVPQATEPPDRVFFDEHDFFGRSLDGDLITDFLYKARRPLELESRFDFDVPYRFASGHGAEGREVSRAGPPPVIGILEFSRVAFDRRESQALVYVGIDRPDRTGAGFLFWLRRTGREWEIVDSEVVWVARP